LINKLNHATSLPITPERAQAAAGAFTTPNYHQPSVIIDLSQRSTLILPKELKDELKSVPWNW